MKRIRVPTPAPKPKAVWRQSLGGRAFQQGHGAEWIAAVWLMLKGYQLLGFRLKTPGAEIDILARRGRTLVVVEVKQRATMAAALIAIDPRQLERLRQAGAALLRQRPSLAGLLLRIDTVALAPRRFPRHRRNL
ncbi:MAG: YraN family protein [Alphaproteobacteria bacterium]|nr:YraN family protein [Alphaproteobacteria bacterium]MBU2379649.1 YraN family protein [Alphaproteobacteria bacterium]